MVRPLSRPSVDEKEGFTPVLTLLLATSRVLVNYYLA
tara:strand:+ start:1506 stop:1616 length:111 start_codon:yes stop_codon:yes gene_type:complete